MSDVENAHLRASLKRLFKDGGLEVSEEALDRVAGLHRHYATGLARLSRVELGETEPATVFSVEAARPGSDDERD